MEKRKERGGKQGQKRILLKLYRFSSCFPLQIAAHPRSRYRPITMSPEEGPPEAKTSMEPQAFPTRQSYFEVLKRHARPGHALSPARKRLASQVCCPMAFTFAATCRACHACFPGGGCWAQLIVYLDFVLSSVSGRYREFRHD